MKRLVTNLGLLQIFCALLLVIVIMFVSNFIVYRNSISDIYKQMSENNALAVQSVIQTFDNSFQSINHVIHAIHGLPYNNLYSQDGTLDMNRVYTMQSQVENIASANNLIEEVVVFYDGVPLAITTKGTSSLEHLFKRKYRHELYDVNFWRNFVRSKHDLKVFPVENYTVLSDTTNEYKKKSLMVVVGGNKVAMSNKHILVFVNASKLLQDIVF